MVPRRARRRAAGTIPRTAALALMTVPLSYSGWAQSDPPCERYALQGLSPGMSREMVRSKMGGDGIRTLIRIPGSGETSGVEYPGPTFDVYVEYDRRVDRQPPARAVRVRASMPLSPTTVQTLVGRFGRPDVGADDLVEGLHEGAAVWVDEACGVVLTAYRSSTSWWTAGGGMFLQVETLDLARQGGSPASPRLSEILAQKTGPPAAPLTTISKTLPAPPPLTMRITATLRAASPAPSPEARTIPPSPPPSTPPPPMPRKTNTPTDKPAERITFVPPVYPATAKWLGVKGRVTLTIDVRADGSVANRPRVVAAHPAGRGFEEAAVEAARRWRFKPAIRGGRSVASSLRFDIDFE